MADIIGNGSDEMDMTADLYTLIDEDGQEQVFEMIDSVDVGEDRYYAFTEYNDDPESNLETDGEFIVLKSEFDENDEEIFVSVDDDEENERIGKLFIDRWSKDFE